jgi:hypothetical protein
LRVWSVRAMSEPALQRPWWFICQRCAHYWKPALLVGCEVGVCLAQWKAIRCPICASGRRDHIIFTGDESELPELAADAKRKFDAKAPGPQAAQGFSS